MTNTDKPDLLAHVQSLPYPDQVKHWGSSKPWGKLGSRKGHIHLRHKGIEFSPDDVTLDSDGNITDIPPYNKPCLGTVAVLRHGSKTQTRRDRYGRDVETSNHRCGNCKVRDACRKIITARIVARPNAKAKFLLWRAEAIRALGSEAAFNQVFGRNHTIYTSDPLPGFRLGYLWRDFLDALAEDGPFGDSNEAVLQQQREEEDIKDRARRRRNKQIERERSRAAGDAPDAQFELDLAAERDRRERVLRQASDAPDAHASVGQLDERGCAITAHVWAEKTLLEEMGEEPTAGKIAKRLFDRGVVEDIKEESLRQRIYRTDFKRIAFLESDRSGPIWTGFDPLKSAETDEWYDLAA
jgi:hypothetical protein